MTKFSPQRPRGFIRGLTHRLRFHLERLVLRGLGFRLLIAAVIVAVVALVAGELAVILVPELSDPGSAIWWAFLRLTDPGYLGDDQGIAQRTISTVVTVLGYVLFLGLLIAILTQWLNQFINKLESGVSPVAVSNHIVLLGWTHRTPTIVKQLLRSGKRAERFLKKRGARTLGVVILAENTNQDLMNELKERLGPLWNDRQVMMRSGTPLLVEHLERVAFREAAVLILPGADFAEQSPGVVDAETIKTLLSVSKHIEASGSQYPLVVAGLFDASRSAIARKAYSGDNEIVATDEIVARLIAQSMRQKGLGSVFFELLTPHVGNAFYVRSHEELAGLQFGDLRIRFPHAIVLGTVRPGDLKPALNPDPETRIREGDLLVFIARSYDDCAPGPAVPGGNIPAKKIAPRPVSEDERRVLILGWSSKVPSLLQELERYGGESLRIDVASLKPVEERKKLMAIHGFGSTGKSVRHIEANFGHPAALEGLKPERYDNILIVARESMSDEAHADAASASTYLMLRSLLLVEGRGPELTVEILEKENLFLFDDRVEDVIVSPLLISYFMSQIALRREMAAVFSEISDTWGAQIILEPAADFVPTHEPVKFSDIEDAAGENGLIALGLQQGSGVDTRLELNPDQDSQWELVSDDKVVVLATFEK